VTLSAADLAAMPHREVKVGDAVLSGIAVSDLLQRAGAPAGADLHREKLALYLLVEAADGYRVVFSLPELDPAFGVRTALLVDRRDSKPLSSDEGPFHLVLPDEKVKARWVRQAMALTVKKG